MKQKMLIQDYEVWVNLGCSTEEQKHAQPVHFNLEINFDSPVLGCKTDNLNDAIDYVKVTSILKMISTEKPFQLVEHLNYQAFSGVIEYLKAKELKGEIKLSVKKIRVPVENLKNGVVFSCEIKL
ncbi:MAG: dihydroneopterin aldolase [Pseudobdellovibrio sp.]